MSASNSCRSHEELQAQAAQLPLVFGSHTHDASLPPMPGTSPGTAPGAARGAAEELEQARREIALLKSMDPFRAAEMALELQVEKMRADDAARARDAAVQRLASAYDAIRQKAVALARALGERDELACRLNAAEGALRDAAVAALEGESARLAARLNAEAAALHRGLGTEVPVSRSPALSEATEKTLQDITNGIDHLAIEPKTYLTAKDFTGNLPALSSVALTPALKLTDFNPLMHKTYDCDYRVVPPSREPEDMAKARFAILASLPIPACIPADALKPIIIPAPYTLHEFLSNAPNSIKTVLAGYRAFQDSTTVWCPEREEHGIFLTPLYKCNTNPRVATAHRWGEVDPRGKMTRPTECFYSKDGKWYYAGQYVALRLEDLTPAEWEALETEAAAALVKETLAARRNTSPQNHYEAAQLYAAGALRVACVGLQCVGFNAGLCAAVAEQAARCERGGHWRSPWGPDGGAAEDAGAAVEMGFGLG